MRNGFLENKRTHVAQLDFGAGAQAQSLFKRGKAGPKNQPPAFANRQWLLRRGHDQVGNQVGWQIQPPIRPSSVLVCALPDVRRAALARVVAEFDVALQIGGANGSVENERDDLLRAHLRMVRPAWRKHDREGRRFHAPAQNGRRRVSIRARQTGPQGKFVAVVQRQRFGRQKHAAARAEPGENAAQGRFDDQRRRLRGMADLVRPRHRLVEAQFKGGGGTGRGRIEDQFDVFGAIMMEIAAQEQQGRAGGKKKFHRTAGRSSFKV